MNEFEPRIVAHDRESFSAGYEARKEAEINKLATNEWLPVEAKYMVLRYNIDQALSYTMPILARSHLLRSKKIIEEILDAPNEFKKQEGTKKEHRDRNGGRAPATSSGGNCPIRSTQSSG